MSARRLLPALYLLAAFAAVPTHAAGVEVVNAEFGLFEADSSGATLFSPSRSVPRKPGQRYGWLIELRADASTPRSVLVREEYLQPSRAPVVRSARDDSLRLTDVRRHQVSERRLVPVDGQIAGEWMIGADEPAGERHLVVVIEGAPETRFDYRVE